MYKHISWGLGLEVAQKHFICWPKQAKPSWRSGEIDFPSWLQLLQSHIAESGYWEEYSIGAISAISLPQ